MKALRIAVWKRKVQRPAQDPREAAGVLVSKISHKHPVEEITNDIDLKEKVKRLAQDATEASCFLINLQFFYIAWIVYARGSKF